MQIHTQNDEGPSDKRHTKGQQFYKDNIDDPSNEVVFLNGDERINRLLFKSIKYMFLVFESKKQNDETKKEKDI